jgi:DNA repair protein RadC
MDDLPRERLYEYGKERITDAELIALILGTGIRGKSAVHLAEEVLADSGGVAALAHVSPLDLTLVNGIGRARAARLVAAFALGLRAIAVRTVASDEIRCAADIYDRVWPRYAGLAQEVFLIVGINARNGVIAELEVARGCLTGVDVHPREVFRPAIRMAAAAVIAVHNHPSGDPSPSPEDVALTQRLRTVGDVVGIPLVDHVIVAARGYCSMAEWNMGNDP